MPRAARQSGAARDPYAVVCLSASRPCAPPLSKIQESAGAIELHQRGWLVEIREWSAHPEFSTVRRGDVSSAVRAAMTLSTEVEIIGTVDEPRVTVGV